MNRSALSLSRRIGIVDRLKPYALSVLVRIQPGVLQKSAWHSGCAPAFQVGLRGFEPRRRLLCYTAYGELAEWEGSGPENR